MRIGTCGFCESRSRIYKDFNALELQKTFYDFVNEDWLKKLSEEAPESFEFTVKGIQIITHRITSPTYRRFKSNFGRAENYGHFRDTEEIKNAMEKMVQYAKILGSRIIVLQSPPDFSESDENIENLRKFFKMFSKRGIIYGWEPRGKWENSTIRKIAEELGIIHVVDPFKNESTYGEFKYYRLHGKVGYSYFYDGQDLLFLKKIAMENDYVMFNNTHMCENARTFREMIKHDVQDTS